MTGFGPIISVSRAVLDGTDHLDLNRLFEMRRADDAARSAREQRERDRVAARVRQHEANRTRHAAVLAAAEEDSRVLGLVLDFHRPMLEEPPVSWRGSVCTACPAEHDEMWEWPCDTWELIADELGS